MDLNNSLKEMSENWVQGSYSMFSLKISLKDDSEEENRPSIMHEYTHYLQNITTFHGFTKIDDYIRLFLFIFTKLGSNQVDPTIPLNKDKNLMEELENHNLENLNKSRKLGMERINNEYIFDDYICDDYSIIIQEIINPYHNKKIQMPFLIINNKKIPLNEIVIRENMAMINTVLSESSDMESKYKKISAFKYKEYTSIFLFIIHYFPDKDTLQLTYQICELALNVLPIEKSIYNIIQFIKDNYKNLNDKNEINIIEEIKINLNYIDVFNRLYSTVQKMANERIEMFDKIIKTNGNDFVIFLKNFYFYILKGLGLRFNKQSLYLNPITNDYLNSLISIIGSPFIYYENKKVVRQLNNIDTYFLDDFIFLHSSLEVFFTAYYEKLQCCPFYNSGICKEDKNNNCKDNCLQNFMQDNYELCLLNNSLLCSGIRSIERWENEKIGKNIILL